MACVHSLNVEKFRRKDVTHPILKTGYREAMLRNNSNDLVMFYELVHSKVST